MQLLKRCRVEMKISIGRLLLFCEYVSRFLLGGLWYGELTSGVYKNEIIILKDTKQSTFSSLLRNIDKDILRKKREKDIIVGVDLSWVENVLDILSVCN